MWLKKLLETFRRILFGRHLLTYVWDFNEQPLKMSRFKPSILNREIEWYLIWRSWKPLYNGIWEAKFWWTVFASWNFPTTKRKFILHLNEAVSANFYFVYHDSCFVKTWLLQVNIFHTDVTNLNGMFIYYKKWWGYKVFSYSNLLKYVFF